MTSQLESSFEQSPQYENATKRMQNIMLETTRMTTPHVQLSINYLVGCIKNSGNLITIHAHPGSRDEVG